MDPHITLQNNGLIINFIFDKVCLFLDSLIWPSWYRLDCRAINLLRAIILWLHGLFDIFYNLLLLYFRFLGARFVNLRLNKIVAVLNDVFGG